MSLLPLLRLPVLVLNMVFNQLRPCEKIMLSLCSKRTTRHIIQSRYTSEKVTLNLDLLEGRVQLFSENDRFDIDIHISSPHYLECFGVQRSFTIADHNVPTVFELTEDGYKMTTFWNTLPEGIRFISTHLSQIFPCRISEITSSLSKTIIQKTISGLAEEKLEIEKLHIDEKSSDEKWLKDVLKKLKVIDELIISSKFSLNFKSDFGFWPERLEVVNSQWVTRDILKTSTSASIKLEDSSMNNEDIDMFLNDWKSGSLSNLKCLMIRSSRFNNKRQVSGMKPPVMDMNNSKPAYNDIGGVQSTILDGVKIQSDNGVKATIKLSGSQFQMIVED